MENMLYSIKLFYILTFYRTTTNILDYRQKTTIIVIDFFSIIFYPLSPITKLVEIHYHQSHLD